MYNKIPYNPIQYKEVVTLFPKVIKNYSTKSFFRHIPNALLARYFYDQGLFSELDIATMKETKIDALFEAWLSLSKEQRNEMDTTCQEIFDMCCEKGWRAILDQANVMLRDNSTELDAFVEKMSSLPNHYHRVMTAFLDYQNFWRVATLFYHADTLSYWWKRKRLGHRLVATDDASV